MNNTIHLTLDSDSVFVLHAIAGRHPVTENALRCFMRGDAEGREILSRDLHAPGRQLDGLQARGFIAFKDDGSIVTTDMLKHLVITVAKGA